MGKRGTGAVFCLTAGILFSARYITAALFMSNITSWDSALFSAGLEYQSSGLLIAAIVSLIIGIIYIIGAEKENRKEI